ncbi:hypothetical protein ABH994_005589 [Bradyrhizobium yuanmingense]|uniref:hypothetical protein n=1 Tax=Bradyrhizobium yuanmingense TaxID=108015 RepID=UPI0035150DD8
MAQRDLSWATGDRGKAQHHIAGDSEMEAIEPPDCAAPVEIGNGARALLLHPFAPSALFHVSSGNLNVSGPVLSISEFSVGDGSLSGACICPTNWELRLMFACILFRVSKLVEHTPMCIQPCRNLTMEVLLTKRPHLVVTIDQ